MIRFVLTVIFACLRAVPMSIAVAAGRLLGWLLRVVLRFRRRVIRTNMDIVFGDRLDAAGRVEMERQIYEHLGLLTVELLRLPGCHPGTHQAVVAAGSRAEFDKALARGNGVIFLTGHVGNWEIGGVATTAAGYTLHGVGKAMKNPVAEEVRKMIRDDNGVVNIPARNSVREIIRLLRAGKMIAFPLDQNRTREEGIFVDFFGVPACTMDSLAVLAGRTDATIVPAALYRNPDLRSYTMVVRPMFELEHPHEDAKANVRHNTRRLNQALEELIMEHPAQWMWIHKRWKTRPADESPPRVVY